MNVASLRESAVSRQELSVLAQVANQVAVAVENTLAFDQITELKDRLAEIPKDKPVIAVCHAGMRSGQATVILRGAGFPRVANLHGGMLLWQQMGLPVVCGTGSEG